MIKGLYSSAAAMVAQFMRQQVIANNLANVNTPGFKEDRTVLRNVPRQVIGREEFTFSDLLLGVNPGLVGEIGTGVQIEPPRPEFAQGSFRPTGRQLDLALAGPGFFTVQTPTGVMYTRSGNFSRNALGQLVTSRGDLVLGSDGNPINVGQGDFTIRDDGSIIIGDEVVGQLSIVDFTDVSQLEKVGNNLFTSQAAPIVPPGTTVVTGALEMANVDLAQNMTEMLSARRMYEASQQLFQMQDQMLDRAINEVGRLPR